MKKCHLIIGVIYLSFVLSAKTGSAQIPFPSPGHEGLNVKKIGNFALNEDKNLQLGFWTQNRVLYNYSNIPGPGGTAFDSTKYYDFFRQRFRAGVDIRLVNDTGAAKAGAYMQFEYRGGWGGSSPMASDPRGNPPVNNPYNRLQPRGIRYGFVYYNLSEKLNFSAGILPLTDRVGRVLFDADWDFNVGGITLGGKLGKGDYRLGYVRLMDYVGSGSINSIGINNELLIADYDIPFSDNFTAGGHFYALTGPFNNVSSEMWFGATATAKLEPVTLNGMFLYNTGEIGGETHGGMAMKLEASIELGKAKWSLEALYTSGDKVDSLGVAEISGRFITLHQLVGTAGYWGYMHIFTPAGPSDVNDLGLEPGNGGAGLTTIQTKLDFPIIEKKLNGQIFGGWFSANEERNGSINMGIEAGGMLTYSFSQYLNLEAGAAYAAIGEFYTDNPDGLLEVFSRLQFTW